jgi:hypothetical protein
VSEPPRTRAGHPPSGESTGTRQPDLPPEAAYVAAIEARLSELSNAPLILSPRDWERVRGWYRRAIPLDVVLRALSDALARPPAPPSHPAPATAAASPGRSRRRVFADDAGSAFPGLHRRPYSLAYCERAVEQRWKSHREGGVGRDTAAGPAPARVRSALHELAREVTAAARTARADPSRRPAAPVLRALAGRLRTAARSVRTDADPFAGTAAALLQADAALRGDLRAALAGEWETRCDEEHRRLSPRLAHMNRDAARTTIEAAALQRSLTELGVPPIDPGALQARLLRKSAPPGKR